MSNCIRGGRHDVYNDNEVKNKQTASADQV